MSIFPNPVKDKMIVRFVGNLGGKYQLHLVNAQGQTCYSTTFEGNGAAAPKTFNLPEFVSSGNYIVQLLVNGNIKMSEKVLVVR